MAPPDHASTRVERASHLRRASFLLQRHACVDGSLRPPRLASPRLALDSTAPSARLGLAQTIRLSVARPYSLALSLVPARYTSLSLARLLFRHFPHFLSLSPSLSEARQQGRGGWRGARGRATASCGCSRRAALRAAPRLVSLQVAPLARRVGRASARGCKATGGSRK